MIDDQSLHEHRMRLLNLAQQWMYGTISQEDLAMLDSWFYSLEGKHLVVPDFTTIEILEQRIAQQFFKTNLFKLDDSMPNPWHDPEN